MRLHEILMRLDHVSRTGKENEYMARCPAHDDKTASLSVGLGAGRDNKARILLCCHAGCGIDAILAAMGLQKRDLIVDPDPDWQPKNGRGNRNRAGNRSQAGSGSASGSGSGNQAGDGSGNRNQTGNGSGNRAPADEMAVDPETGEILPDQNGNPFRVRTDDAQGRTLGPESGEAMPEMRVDPESGEIILSGPIGTVETLETGAKVYTVGGGAAGAGTGSEDVPWEDGSAAAMQVGQDGSGRQGNGNQSGQAGQDGSGRQGNGNQSGQSGQGNGGQGAKKEEKKGPQIDYGHPDRIYSYTDEDGKELFQVVRYHYVDAPGKTFRQRRKDPGNPRANREGYVGSVPAEIRDVTLYRMPNIRKAISEGRTLYVVEGEKDVETLERLGFPATCNPGGAGKWTDGYTRQLAGADVIILPDNDTKENDYTGQNHAYRVAMSLKDVAKRVRLIDIREACPELPPKGDISDMVQLMGDTGAMDALARQVAATPDFDQGAVPFWYTPMEQARVLYQSVEGYAVQDGCIVQRVQDGVKKLTDFVVIPRMELTRDDGVSKSLNFVLDGWNSKGQRLNRVVIGAKELDAMNWVTENWGFKANLAPGSTVKSKVAWTINKVGQMTAKRVTEYSHTGWRYIGGKWVYLYQGGAVGMEGVTVNIGENGLNTYRLDGSGAPGFDQIPYKEAAEKSLMLQTVAKEEIGLSLLGVVYLAPLREWMSQTDITPAFSLFLYGETQIGKSVMAALAMSHYGNFHTRNAPASFNDTSNAIRTKAFLIKDMPLLIDDFHPTGSLQEKKRMATVAQDLSRAYGDGAQRGRLNADGTIRASNPPRSVAIITGEDLPNIGASGLARYFVVDIEKGDVIQGMGKSNEELTALQEAARAGYLQRAMRGYILWLSKQTDTLPEKMHEMFLTYRKIILQKGAGSQARAPEAVACILMGYAMMLNYMGDLGIFDEETKLGMLSHAVDVLTDMSRAQSRDMESEKPARIFMDNLEELTSSGRVAFVDLRDPNPKEPSPAVTMGGWMDGEYYYLLTNVVYGAVQKLCREQGTEFPVSLKALYKHLRTDGILDLADCGKEGNTKNKKIKGETKRVLWIRREKMNGPGGTVEQMAMDFKKAEGVELPENW